MEKHINGKTRQARESHSGHLRSVARFRLQCLGFSISHLNVRLLFVGISEEAQAAQSEVLFLLVVLFTQLPSPEFRRARSFVHGRGSAMTPSASPSGLSPPTSHRRNQSVVACASRDLLYESQYRVARRSRSRGSSKKLQKGAAVAVADGNTILSPVQSGAAAAGEQHNERSSALHEGNESSNASSEVRHTARHRRSSEPNVAISPQNSLSSGTVLEESDHGDDSERHGSDDEASPPEVRWGDRRLFCGTS